MLGYIALAALVVGGLLLAERHASADQRDFEVADSDTPNADQARLPAPVVVVPTAGNVSMVGATPVNGDGSSYIEYVAKMAIDYDGSPRAYAPADAGLAPLDNLGNAGRPGNWWGIATDTGDKDGDPIIQGDGDPFPGYYVSTTAKTTGAKRGTPAAYLNSELVPYVSIPPDLKSAGARLGNLARVSVGGNAYFAVVGDIGPKGKIGEGSYRLAEALGITSATDRAGGIVYRIFLNTAAPLTDREIQDYGQSTIVGA